MLTIVHLGGGGTYSRYVQDCVRRIARRRSARVLSELRAGGGQHVVVLKNSETPLDDRGLRSLLASHEELTFVVGDSNGVPQSVMMASDECYSLSALSLGHQVQAMVLAEALEAAIYEEEPADVLT